MTTAAAALGLSSSAISNAQVAQAKAALTDKDKAKTYAAAQNFESMFINSMFQQMFAGIDGDGPFGGKGALKVWRSFLTDEYSKTFEKSGGLGIASHVYDELMKQQGARAS
jgi:peptidoglycan hydrolase FlgJ